MCLLLGGVCLLRGRVSAWGVSAWGVSAPGGVCSRGGLLRGEGGLLTGRPGGDPPGTATAAGGTHPTGMHSCFYYVANDSQGLFTLSDSEPESDFSLIFVIAQCER